MKRLSARDTLPQQHDSTLIRPAVSYP